MFFLSKKEPKSDLACTGWGLYDWILPTHRALEKTWMFFEKEPKSNLTWAGWGLYDWILPTHKALEKTWTLSGKESKRRQKPLCQGGSGYRTTFPGRSRTKGLQFPWISDIMAPLWSSTQAGRRGVTRNLVGHESVARVRIPAAPPESAFRKGCGFFVFPLDPPPVPGYSHIS